MMTGEQYLASLDDGRKIFFKGRQIVHPVDEPRLSRAAYWIAETYDSFYRPGSESRNPLFAVPRSSEDLRVLVDLLTSADIVAQTTFQSLLALLTAASSMGKSESGYADRIKAYCELVVREDQRLVECLTDAKGNRALSPSHQADRDAYVHVVGREADGVVVRGAKLHITGASYAHDLIVMPTKRMKAGEEEYAIACAIPLSAPGVSVINTTYAPAADDDGDYPFSRRENMADGFVVLDDVFVPYERVFLDGEVHQSASFAHSLGLWERLVGTSEMAHDADLLVGLAQLTAEANGLQSIPHIREKVSGMVIYATLIRAGLESALLHVGRTPDEMVYPSELYTNAAKFYGAASYALMVRDLHDLAGGSVATAPSVADLANPATGDLVRKYMSTGENVSGEYRLRIFHAIRDFTADALGGWRSVATLQSGGGLYAQRLVTYKHYDIAGAKQAARRAFDLE
jgi:4-hydroxybutyryl-CoA dehydratase / vinylacetyl-CoA-Delta-isomerase